MQDNDQGLRERQRRDRLLRLHEAAYELVGEGGPAAVTVDAITAKAGVSRRTFFNYYASKEDAVLGLTPPSIPGKALDAFLDEGSEPDRLTRTVHLILAIGKDSRQGPGQTDRRRDLVQRFPELAARLKQHWQAVQDLVFDALAEQSPPIGEGGEADGTEKAKVLVLLAGAVLRFAHERDPRVLDGGDPAAIDPAVSVFRSLMEEI